KKQGSQGRTAKHGAGVQLRVGLAGAVAGDIDDIGGNPVAATFLVVVVGGDIHVHPLGGGEFGAHIAEQVLPQGGPTPAVLLVDVGNAGPVAGEAIPVGIFPECLQGDAFVVVFVNVVVGEVSGPAHITLADDLGGKVLAVGFAGFVDGGIDVRAGAADPGIGAGQKLTGVVTQISLLGIEITTGDIDPHALLHLWIDGSKVEGAPQGLVGTGRNIGSALGYLDARQVGG